MDAKVAQAVVVAHANPFFSELDIAEIVGCEALRQALADDLILVQKASYNWPGLFRPYGLFVPPDAHDAALVDCPGYLCACNRGLVQDEHTPSAPDAYGIIHVCDGICGPEGVWSMGSGCTESEQTA